ncbi:unnamed protein product [Rotaria socialis]|uniref:Uncharacterized protein n=1 Tax=Rotaria socialis TaxID=392032 RepID=A0A818MIQ4_9BILA|nr:unnamed protein product [Rotaria socialis]CAF3464592.1 unnamed protein product [Rotaria socialis]CAF3506329.1 unnamed protein product [Rotaria socialis]CAF3589929.1 unnamed protein product [Rotaria socialis]CAF3617178.1 unnamed protein product [Rotaria socialis]
MNSYNNTTCFSTTHHHVNQESSYTPITDDQIEYGSFEHGTFQSICTGVNCTFNQMYNHCFEHCPFESAHITDSPEQRDDDNCNSIESTHCTFNSTHTDYVTHDSFTPIHTTDIDLQCIEVERN